MLAEKETPLRPAVLTAGHHLSPYQDYQDPTGGPAKTRGLLAAQDDAQSPLQKLGSKALLPNPSVPFFHRV